MPLKKGVRVSGIKPELLLALQEAREVYARAGEQLMITSLLDGTHKRTSLHYTGCAADLRLPGWPQPDLRKAKAIVSELRAFLGDDYDVILERDHIHLEFDPRTPVDPAKTQA